MAIVAERARVSRMADRDERLAVRALREAWPVPEGRREELVEILLTIARDPAAGKRDRLSAVNALLQAGRLNIEAIRTALAAEYADVVSELEALRAQLGSGPAGHPPADGDGGYPGGDD